MKSILTIIFLAVFFCLHSCDEGKTSASTDLEEKADAAIYDHSSDVYFDINQDSLLNDFRSWYVYTFYNIRLGQEFIALSMDSTEISKSSFLDSLSKGRHAAFRTAVKSGIPVYKLHRFHGFNGDISSTISQMAKREIKHYSAEGSDFPDYSLVDLDGNRYSKSSIHGSILVIKCWFINCVACVKEFPALNNLVDEYKENRNIKFVSLAIDNSDKLRSFLTIRDFKYAVVPDAGDFMSKTLKVDFYPTHILVDDMGKILKVTSSVDDLIPALRELAR